MRDWFGSLRALAGHDDRRDAYAAESSAMSAATKVSSVDPRFAADMARVQASPLAIRIGTASRDPRLAVSLAPDDVMGKGHALVLGGNGTGKTRVVAGIVRALFRRIARAPESCGLWIVDHKSEFASLARELLEDVLRALPEREAYALLDRFVVIDPFSTRALVPLQILRPEPGVEPELQAAEVATVLNRLGGADLGVRQDDFVYHLVLLGVTAGLSLVDLATLTSEPAALAERARGSHVAAVREYFGGAQRIAATSLEGVRSRLHRVLRLRAARLMLGARDSVSFPELMRSKIVVIDTGSPDLGCEDLARYWAGIFTLKVTRSIFSRSQVDAARPVAIMVDEWQEGLAAGGDISEHYERVLSMARSRGVSLWLISQSLAMAARVSASLPNVVATNANVNLLFRAAIQDARALEHLLPITGRRPREAPAPWEEHRNSPYLSPSEERERLVAEVASLPDRTFYLWNRRRGYQAQLVRAADVSPSGAPVNADIARRLRDGALAVPIARLEAELQAPRRSLFRPLAAVTTPPETLPPRRPRRRRGPDA